VLHAYGSTLLIAILSASTLGLLQLGDGDIVVGTRGRGSHRPLPDDARLIANETTSLCLDSAVADFRLAAIDLAVDPIDVVLLATDGYGNSFLDQDWPSTVGAEFLSLYESETHEGVGRELPGWLADSAAVAGDDTTAALAFRAGDPPEPGPEAAVTR
jgi:hypothetical protein